MLLDFLIVLSVLCLVLANMAWANPLSAEVYRQLVTKLGGSINFGVIVLLLAVVITAWVQNLRILK